VEGISNEGLGVKVPAPNTLGDGHEEIDKQSNTSNSDSGIMLVPADEVDIFARRVMVMVADTMGMGVTVGVTRVVTGAVKGSH